MIALLGVALAAEPSVAVGVRVDGEAWSDPAISSVYRPGGLGGSLTVQVPLMASLDLDLEGGVTTVKHDELASLRLIPMSLLVEWHRGPLFVGAGPALAVFTERDLTRPDELAAVSGARPMLEARLGARIDTGLVVPPMPPAPAGPIRALDVEIWVGRRQQLGKTGFDLGAFRAGVGLLARFE